MSNRKLPDGEKLGSITGYERRLLGCVLINPTVLARIGMILAVEDFLDAGLGAMYGAMLVLSDAGKLFPDIRWLHREFFKLGVPQDLCIECNLTQLIEEAVNESSVVFYAEEIAKAASIRRLQVIATDMQRRASEADADPKAIRQFLEAKLVSLDRIQPHDFRTIYDIAGDALAAIDVPCESSSGRGSMSGIERLDAAAGANLSGELVIVGGRPGSGKTALKTQIGIHNAERGRAVGMVSLEMRSTEIALRMLCGRAKVDSR